MLVLRFPLAFFNLEYEQPKGVQPRQSLLPAMPTIRHCDALFAEVQSNKSRFAMYRSSLDVVVAALQGAGRPEEALQFLRVAAQLDMSMHGGVSSYAADRH